MLRILKRHRCGMQTSQQIPESRVPGEAFARCTASGTQIGFCDLIVTSKSRAAGSGPQKRTGVRLVVQQATACVTSIARALGGLFFDDLCCPLQAKYPLTGVQCRGSRIPSLFYADDVALLLALAQGLQGLLDSMQSFCAANSLTISVAKTEVVVFGRGYHMCARKIAGQDLKRSLCQGLCFNWGCLFPLL